MRFLVFFIFLASILSCNRYFEPQKLQYKDYKVSKNLAEGDAALSGLLQPYQDSVFKTMNTVIGELAEPLEKKQPNGSLGLVLVDALREMAAVHYQQPVDAAFINNGGIRIPGVAKGFITNGKIFEIMPFDNVVVLQKVDGTILEQFIQLIARKGGWPVSGITFKAGNNSATNIQINGKPLDLKRQYTIVNSDYIASGGDDADMLRNIPMINDNYLMRTLFIEYFKKKMAAGEKITAPREERIQQ